MIEGLDDAAAVEGVEIFHAGTKAEGGKILANGGRVLDVSALGKTVSEAQAAPTRRYPHPLARRLLPPRHRLARGGTRGEIMPDLADLYPGYASRWIGTSTVRFLPASATAVARRSCCCTAIRSPTSCGTAWRRCWRRILRW